MPRKEVSIDPGTEARKRRSYRAVPIAARIFFLEKSRKRRWRRRRRKRGEISPWGCARPVAVFPGNIFPPRPLIADKLFPACSFVAVWTRRDKYTAATMSKHGMNTAAGGLGHARRPPPPREVIMLIVAYMCAPPWHADACETRLNSR